MAKALISLVPEVVDLKLYAGDGAAFNLTVTDDAGAPLDLTGEVEAMVRKARGDATPKATFTCAVDANVVAISLSGEQTATLAPSGSNFDGAWDVQWTPEDGDTVTLVQGKLTCVADVTR